VAHNDDLRFNRIRRGKAKYYLKEYGADRHLGDHIYQGFIKCKLVHANGYSVVIPDQVYVDMGGGLHWIQPLYFSGCMISQLEEYGTCSLSIDISHGVLLNVEFSNEGLVSKLNDGSLLYQCEIKAPQYLYRYTTGRSKIDEGVPLLKLHHHTTRDAKRSITSSGEFWSSGWNIQGTKKNTNISYLYMTSLPAISCDQDLCEIAMSSMGKLAFRVDQNFSVAPDLVIDVYRESTTNRTESLSYWVDSTLLATQPVYRHMPPDAVGYHEIVCPFIHRVGVENGTVIKIIGSHLAPDESKNFDYAVVGDATTVPGLAAPYDEENTEEVFKVELLEEDEDIISFWMANGNTNQYDGKHIEVANFE